VKYAKNIQAMVINFQTVRTLWRFLARLHLHFILRRGHHLDL